MKLQTGKIAAFAFLCWVPAAAQNYTFQTVLTCNNLTAFPYSMNGSGLVAGVAHNISGPGAGMLYSGDKCQTEPSALFYGATDAGAVFAWSLTMQKEYLVGPGGRVKGPLPGYPGAQTDSTVYCCMDTLTGTLAGNYLPPGLISVTGFLYRSEKFISLPDSETSYPISAFNNTGIAVGTSSNATGFLYQKGKITSLRYPGATYTTFNGLNDNGLVVGTYVVKQTGASNVFLYDVGSQTWTDLNFPYPYDAMFPVGISNAGVIVLQYSLSGGMVIATPTGN